MEDKKIISAPVSSRFLAFLIDIFFVYLLRFLYINLSLQFWLKEPIQTFMTKYKMLYGSFNLGKLTPVEIYYFLNSSLFKQLAVFVIGVFLIAVVYNFVLFSTKWSATIGQKIMGIRIASKNGEKMKFYQVLARSFAVVLPWFFIFVILFYKSLADLGLTEMLDKTSFVVSIVIFLSWYDLVFFTKDKLVFHDLLTGTRAIIGNVEKYNGGSGSLWTILFPNFKDMYYSIKEFTKEQISKAKEMKEKYKQEKELKKKDK